MSIILSIYILIVIFHLIFLQVPEVVVCKTKPPARTSSKWHDLTRTTLENKAPHVLLPTKEWTEIQVKEFQTLQEKVSKRRRRAPQQIKTDFPDDEDDKWKDFCRANPPKLTVLMSLSQKQLESLLEHESNWLKESNLQLHSEDFWLGQWIYGSLVCLMIPLEPNLHHIIREIARFCIRRRNSVACPVEVLPLNVLICIISVHFKQLDLLCG